MFVCVWECVCDVYVCGRALTDPGDQVVVQVQDLQAPAPQLQVLDPLDVLLVQRDLLQGPDLTIVVLRTPPQQLLCDCTTTHNNNMENTPQHTTT